MHVHYTLTYKYTYTHNPSNFAPLNTFIFGDGVSVFQTHRILSLEVNIIVLSIKIAYKIL